MLKKILNFLNHRFFSYFRVYYVYLRVRKTLSLPEVEWIFNSTSLTDQENMQGLLFDHEPFSASEYMKRDVSFRYCFVPSSFYLC